jgi:hypothetical protein
LGQPYFVIASHVVEPGELGDMGDLPDTRMTVKTGPRQRPATI